MSENFQVYNDWLIERGAQESEYPAGAVYGSYPMSDAEPLAHLTDIPGYLDPEVNPAVAEMIRAAKAEGWDEGYETGMETQYGKPTPGGYPNDPDANPYREERR